jgi:DMSO/TMAO reductase YedYZ molybdopterin-dependent catalytic subunit
MKRGFAIGRRRFVAQMLAWTGLLSLSGCDRLSQSRWFQEMLSTAEPLDSHLQHLLASRTSMAKEFSEADLSAEFPSNGTHYPPDSDYQVLAADGFKQWQLNVTGLVEQPMDFSLDDLRQLPSRTQITRHDCVEGWSAIAKWKGTRMSALLDRVQPLPTARYVVCYCYDTMDPSGAQYYESIDFEDAYHPQTILVYEWNDEVLPIRYGAPLRLRVERQLGYKMPKYLKRIELVEGFNGIADGKGGYWEDRGYEWFAGI